MVLGFCLDESGWAIFIEIFIFSHRLIASAGSETVEAAYMVGIYSDKKMVAKGVYCSTYLFKLTF